MAVSTALLIALLLVVGLAAPGLHRVLKGATGPVLACFPLAGFVWLAAGAAGSPGPSTFSIPWAPGLGISLGFFVDGLSTLFLLIITAVGTFVVLYAGGYLHGKAGLGRFYMSLFGFMAAMLGVVSADNLILLFVFWELTSITSFLLIGYYHEDEKSRKCALQALLVTGAGGLAMLAGFILLGTVAGTFEISGLLALPDGALAAHPQFPIILVLILLGAFTKSAQFPFHFWLPNAMAAPAPVSSFLHSATMVKAGVFLLARLHPALESHPLWLAIVAPVGAVTMMLGVFLAFAQTDLKKILAYTTLAVLGTLTLLLGLGTDLAIKAALTYLLAHALYKAALFMTAGSVDHETGTRDIRELTGLRRAMPFTAVGAVLGALSMAGLPLFIGFIGKEYFYKALLDADGPPFLWETLGVGASVLMVSLALTAGVRPYTGPAMAKMPHEAPWTMWLGPIVLGALAIQFGLFPGWVGTHLITPAAAAVIGDAGYVAKLKLWHGLTPALALSALTVGLGLLAFRLSAGGRALAAAIVARLSPIGPERAYERILDGVLAFARLQTAVLQSGKLRNYVLITVGFATVLLAVFLPKSLPSFDFTRMVPPSLLGTSVCVVMVIAAIASCLVKSRFTAILTLGVVGLGVAILFFLFSAPDLAMTQILVETLTVVLFVLAFHKLPLLKEYSSGLTRLRDGVLAAAFGVVITLLVMIAFHFRSTPSALATYMGENSLTAANGRNVVNVILVDFRALDTLGEITVLAIAALGVFAMLKLRPNKP